MLYGGSAVGNNTDQFLTIFLTQALTYPNRYHSPETAVTKVFNDLLLATDGGQMLDLTAAFDTVDHELLLDYSGLSDSSVCVASCCTGFGCICLAEPSVLCSADVR